MMNFQHSRRSVGQGLRRSTSAARPGSTPPPSRGGYAGRDHHSGGATADRITVGIGELAVGRAPQHIITHALGSCVALCAYDLDSQVAGMLHFMLPDSRIDVAQARRRPHAFLDLGLEALLQELRAAGAALPRLQVKLVGGAALQEAGTSSLNIGHRNVLAARKLLWRHGLRVVGEDVAGTYSRTAILDARTGIVTVQTPRQQARRV